MNYEQPGDVQILQFRNICSSLVIQIVKINIILLPRVLLGVVISLETMKHSDNTLCKPTVAILPQ